MNRREILPIAILLVIAAIACILLAAPYIFPPDTGEDSAITKSDLNYLKTNIKAVLTPIVDSTCFAADTPTTGDTLSAAEVQPVLDRLYSTSGYALSYAAIAPDGTIIAVAPEAYAGSVGVNIAGSEPGKTIIQMREPFLSDAFVAQEGFMGIEIACPILSGNGTYSGSIITMAEPSAFVGDIVAPIEDKKGITVTVMQPDGFILYDRDAAQVGKNLFRDIPFTNYPSLQELGTAISVNTSGSGEYSFYTSPETTGDAIQKQADWDTMVCLDKEWRIIIFQNKIST